MDLEFSEDEAELRQMVTDVLDGISPPSVVRAIYEGTGDDSDVWAQMVELDWPALTIDEAHGGVGFGYLELAIVAEQIGAHTTPGPFLATASQFAPAVRELGDEAARAAWLPRIAAGEITGSLAIAEGGRWSPDAVTATATREGDGWRLEGRKEAVVHGAAVDEVVVVVRGAEGLGAFVVARGELTVEPRVTIDPTLPIADVVLGGVVVGADRVLAEPGSLEPVAVERVLEEATVAMATNVAAACREIFQWTVDYSKEREQYGRPIGSFQALKHRMADMYLAVERASSLCWFAALTITEDDPRRHEAAALAKAAAGECQMLLVTDGLQLHGGIGFTWEHDLHFFLKRAKAGDALFGNALAHRAELARIIGLVEDEEVVA
ncbi:MAG TPA: acyl-CoA dehydrogenase family protein [Acidimicrobiales bacterium]